MEKDIASTRAGDQQKNIKQAQKFYQTFNSMHAEWNGFLNIYNSQKYYNLNW